MEEEIKFNHSMPAQIRFSDVDQFGHVNNSVYFSLYDLAKTTYFQDVLGMSEWFLWCHCFWAEGQSRRSHQVHG